MSSSLPHFSFDRYSALLRQVEIHDAKGLETILQQMKRIGWVQFLGPEEFRFLRPFHRVFSRCIELAQTPTTPPLPAGAIPNPTP